LVVDSVAKNCTAKKQPKSQSKETEKKALDLLGQPKAGLNKELQASWKAFS